MSVEIPIYLTVAVILASAATLVNALANLLALLRAGKRQAVESASRAELNRSEAAINFAVAAGIEDAVAQRRVERTPTSEREPITPDIIRLLRMLKDERE